MKLDLQHAINYANKVCMYDDEKLERKYHFINEAFPDHPTCLSS